LKLIEREGIFLRVFVLPVVGEKKYRCRTNFRQFSAVLGEQPVERKQAPTEVKMYTHYKMFKSGSKRWSTLCNEASDFASELSEGQLINISHCCDHQTAVVTVWFWDKESSAKSDRGA
jgi:hypothetical protein